MTRDVDRRAQFFLLAAFSSLVLVPVAPEEFRWVGITLCVWLALLGMGSWADHRARRRSGR